MPFFKQGQTNLERQTILSLFIKVMKKFYKYLDGLASKEIQSTLPRLREVSFLMTIYLVYSMVWCFQQNSQKILVSELTSAAVCLGTHSNLCFLFYHLLILCLFFFPSLLGYVLFCPQIVMEPHSVALEEDLNSAAKQVEVCAFTFCFFVFVKNPYPESHLCLFSPPVFIAHIFNDCHWIG